jgi:cytochrome P450
MLKYNPFSEDVMRDPLPVYKQLRDEAPAYYIEEYDAWALSRFEDVWQASLNTENFTTTKGTTPAQLLTKVQPVTPMLNLMDPPEHTRLRTLVRDHFAPRSLRELEGLIRETAAGCLDAALKTDKMDVMAEFSSQVAVRTACTVIGVPREDCDLMNDLVWRFFGREEGVTGMTPDGLKAMEELFGYLVELSRKRRAAAAVASDVVNVINDVAIDGEKLDDMAIASHLAMFVIGGAETFPKTFANIIRRLGEHPEQRARCVADQSLIPNAYLEGLRYDMPTQFLCREVTRDYEIHGQIMKPGQALLLLYHAANHDEREFENPDVFDIDRKIPRLLSFGAGTHACLGIHVAKMEGKVCLEETLRRIPDYQLDLDHAERLVTEFVQGYGTFPIRFKPA